MKTYKGFDKDLKCRGFQYEVGKEYEEKEAKACEKGFHACENPFDVFSYYPPCDGNRYCEVEQDGTLSEHGEDSKVASTKIKIGVELGLRGLIQAGVSLILDRVNWHDNAATNTGNRSAATNTGDRSAAISYGEDSVAINVGNQSTAINKAAKSVALNMGGHAEASVTEEGSIAIATGIQSRAKGGLGSAIVLVERTTWNGYRYPLNNIKAAIVDGEKIKADTWYTLKNGEFVECD